MEIGTDKESKTSKLLELKNKIIDVLKARGPSLPVHISSNLKISMLFASAFLSELLGEKKIKISNMRVGGSPLYLLPGQEPMLENFHIYLPGKEKEAFLMLKENLILQDEKQLPPIRVALQSIKDFAFPISINISDIERKLFWKFFALPDDEAKKIIEKLLPKLKKAKITEKVKKSEKKEKSLEKPLLEIKELKIKKEKIKKIAEKSNFVLNAINFLNSSNIEILEEIESKKKEFIAKVRIDSGLGKIELLAICKDKKKVTENDLTIALQKSQNMKLPCLVVSPGELNKKAQKYIETWKNIIKFKKM